MHNFCQKPILKNRKKFRFNAQFAEKFKVDVDFDRSLFFQNNFLSANFTHFPLSTQRGRELTEVTALYRNVLYRGNSALCTKIFENDMFIFVQNFKILTR